MAWYKRAIPFFLFLKILLLGLLLLAATIFLQQLDYESFVDFCIEVLGRTDLEQRIKQAVSEASFNFTSRALIILCAFYWLVIVPLYWIKRKKLTQQVEGFVSWFKRRLSYHRSSFSNEPGIYKVLTYVVFAIAAVRAVFYAFTWPVQYDGAWTYLHFIDKSLLVPLTAPHNNHVLYTVLAWFFKFLPFEPIVNIRLLLVLFALLSGVAFLLFTRKYFNKYLALILTAVLMFSPVITFYGIYARAYILTVFFTIICLWMVANIILSKGDKWHYWLLVWASVLGLYSMPTFSFVLLGLFMPLAFSQLFSKGLRGLKPAIIASVCVAGFTAILYSPMIMATKFNWLVNGTSKSVKVDFSALSLRWLDEASYFFTGLSYKSSVLYLVLLAVGGVLPFLVKKRQYKILGWLIFFNLVLPLIILFLLRRFTEVRLSSYLIVYMVLLSGLLLRWINRWIKVKQYPVSLWLLPLVIGVLGILSHNHKFMNWSISVDRISREIAVQLEKHNVKNVYNYFNYSKPYIEYYHQIRHKELHFAMPHKHSVNYEEFDNDRGYDAVIWDSSKKFVKPNLQDYRIIYEKDEYSVYLHDD